MEPNSGLGLLLLGIHFGVLIWAITARDPWWALGIFFFPVVGDIAYVIYHFATREAVPTPTGVRKWNVSEGDIVQNRKSLSLVGGHGRIPKSTTMRVVRFIRPGVLEVETKTGEKGTAFPSDLVLVKTAAQGQAFPESEFTPPRPAKNPSPSSSYDEEIRRLAELHKEGLLTDQEFAAKKRQILGLGESQ